jgi:hypothetical protein
MAILKVGVVLVGIINTVLLIFDDDWRRSTRRIITEEFLHFAKRRL